MLEALELAALALPVPDGVLDELQRAGLPEIGDREDRLEDRLQPRVLAVRRGGVDLQEALVRALLHLDQVRDRDGGMDFREVDALTTVGRPSDHRMIDSPVRLAPWCGDTWRWTVAG